MLIVLFCFIALLAYAIICGKIEKKLGIINHYKYKPIVCGTFPLLFLIPLLLITKEKEFLLIFLAFLLEISSLLFISFYVYYKYKLSYPHKPIKYTYYFILPPILLIVYFIFYLIIFQI